MMEPDETVEARTEDLLQAIRNSGVCREYMAAREELSKYPERWQKADIFRRENYIARNFSVDDAGKQRAEISRMREQLRLDPLIDRYLNAELILCRMLKGCALEILNAAQLDLYGMDDIL